MDSTLVASFVLTMGLVWAANTVSRAIVAAVASNGEHEPHCHACKLEADQQEAIDKRIAVNEEIWERDEVERKGTISALALCDHGGLWRLKIRTSDNTVRSVSGSCGQRSEDAASHAGDIAQEFLAMWRRGPK